MIDFNRIGGRLTSEALSLETLLPCIVHWNQNHFIKETVYNDSRKGIGNEIAERNSVWSILPVQCSPETLPCFNDSQPSASP